MRALLLTAIAVIFLFTLTAQVEGVEWKKIRETDEIRLYLDVSSITKNPNNHYEARRKTIFENRSSKFSQIFAYVEFDCDNKKTKTLGMKGFYRKGGEADIDEEQPWINVDPQSNGDLIFVLVCNNYKGNWEADDETDENIFYIDWSSMKKLPNSHYMIWEKIDFKNQSSEQEFRIAHKEYDCVKKGERAPAVIDYKRNGTVFISSDKWKDSERTKTVCNKLSKRDEKTK